MKIVEIRWFVLGALALGLSACDVHVGKCERDDAGDCVDLFPDDEDAGDEEDAGDDLDGGRADSGRADAGDGGRADGGPDGGADEGGSDAGGGEPLTLEEFCEAQLATAVLWREAIGEYCDDDSFTELNDLLRINFAFDPDDAFGTCVTRFGSSNITFEPSKAADCAEAFASQFPKPPATFPDNGIDVSQYTSTIGHGAATHAQLPECREAFKGKVARDAVCSQSLECQGDLRCRQAPGDTTTCQPPLEGGVCLRSSECADGFICVGSAASGGKTCVASDDLPITGNCQFSIECAEGRICNSSGSCAAPVADVVCAP